VHPPAADRIALDATCAARRNRWIDRCTHAGEPTGGRASLDQAFESGRFNQDEQNQMRWGNQPIMVIDGLVRAPSRVDS
jgi:hypothetical protein